jgi:hypothetical protein
MSAPLGVWSPTPLDQDLALVPPPLRLEDKLPPRQNILTESDLAREATKGDGMGMEKELSSVHTKRIARPNPECKWEKIRNFYF